MPLPAPTAAGRSIPVPPPLPLALMKSLNYSDLSASLRGNTPLAIPLTLRLAIARYTLNACLGSKRPTDASVATGCPGVHGSSPAPEKTDDPLDLDEVSAHSRLANSLHSISLAAATIPRLKMQFRLRYEGELRSRQQCDLGHIHDIRCQLQSQLKHLWQLHSNLPREGNSHLPPFQVVRGPNKFRVLVNKKLSLLAELDVLFLRTIRTPNLC